MDEEKFADTGEFSGDGVPPKDSAGKSGDESPAVNPGDSQGASRETPGGAQDKGYGNEQGTEEPEKPAGADDKEEPEIDPLDLPITDFAKVDLGIGDAPVDKVVLEAFGKTCADLKLSARQAAGLAKFQLNAIAESRERLGMEAARELEKRWGGDAKDNQRKIITLVGKVDEATGGKFSQAIEESGAAIYPEFAEGLLRIAAMLGENGLGSITRQGGKPAPETAEEGLREVFASARRS